MKKWLLGLACVGMWAATAMGAINIAPGTPVLQNFDTIGTNAAATLPTDWRVGTNASVRAIAPFSDGLLATTQKGSTNVSTSASAGIYNFGVIATSAERAVGFIASGSAIKTGNLFVELINSGSTAITNLDVAYNVEKYRNGLNASGYQIQLYYSMDGINWTSAGATFLTTFAADADNTGFATAPGATVAVSGVLNLSTPVNAGEMVYLAWSYSVQSGTTTSNSQGLGVDDVSIYVGGEAAFSVTLDKSNGFSLDKGTTGTITATALNGTEPIGYVWSSSLDGAYYSTNANQFTILATAPTGSHSAMVVATDSATHVATNTVTFSVVEKFAISITPPTNGTVTTSSSNALAGTTITITTSNAVGYKVDTISVIAADSSPVTVSTNTFVMPAQSVTVTVTFRVALDTATLPTSFTGPGWYRGANLPDGWTQTGLGTDYTGSYDETGAPGKFDAASASLQIRYASAATELTYWLAFNGTWTNSNVFKVEESIDGTNWTDLAVYDDATPISTAKAKFTNTPAASSRYIQFVYVTKGSGNVGLDGVSIVSGVVVPTLSYTGSTTGTVGQAMSLVFTLHDATASGWEYTLRNADRSQVVTNGSSYTFNWTPPSTGAFHLEMSALDSTNGVLATREVPLTVNGTVEPPPIAPITLVVGGGGDFTFMVPDNFSLVRLEGALPSQLSSNTWTTLVENTDYTVTGTTVRILTTANAGRMVRIVLLPVPLG